MAKTKLDWDTALGNCEHGRRIKLTFTRECQGTGVFNFYTMWRVGQMFHIESEGENDLRRMSAVLKAAFGRRTWGEKPDENRQFIILLRSRFNRQWFISHLCQNMLESIEHLPK